MSQQEKCRECESEEQPIVQGLCTSHYDELVCPYCQKEHDITECLNKQQREQIYRKYLSPSFLLS